MSFYFCRLCRHFTEFNSEWRVRRSSPEGKEEKHEEMYRCACCCRLFSKGLIEQDLFGFATHLSQEPPEVKDKRAKIQSKCNQMLEELNDLQRRRILDELGCPICLELLDMTANLQCLKCKHMFCFYCLIENMKLNNRCPYCKCELSLDTLGTNNNLISSFNLIFEIEKSKGIPCELHELRCDLYCTSCKHEICSECSLSVSHKSHKLITLKMYMKEFKISSIKELTDEKNDNVRSNQLIFIDMVDECLTRFSNTMKKFHEGIISSIDEIHLPFIDKLIQIMKRSDEVQAEISRRFGNEKPENLNEVSEILNTLSIKEASKVTLEFFLQLFYKIIKASISPPIKEIFEIGLTSFNCKNSIILETEFDEFLFIKLEKISTMVWDIQIVFKEKIDLNCYVRVRVIEQDFFKINEQFDIIKLSCGESRQAYKITFDKNKIRPSHKLKIVLNIWEISKLYQNFIDIQHNLVNDMLYCSEELSEVIK